MLYKICPICDQKMKTAHYCANCKCWVRNPLTINVDYYLNERHPEGAHDCTYHDETGYGEYPTDYDDSAGSGRAGEKAAGAGWTFSGSDPSSAGQSASSSSGDAGQITFDWGSSSSGNAGQTASGQSSSSAGSARRAASGRKFSSPAGHSRQAVSGRDKSAPSMETRKKMSVCMAVLVVFLVIAIQFIDIYMDNRSSSGTPETFGSGIATDAPIPDSADDEYQEWELTDEEVLLSGEPCNSCRHLNITREQIEESLLISLREQGLVLDSTRTDSSNIQNNLGDTYYNTFTDYVFQMEDDPDMPDSYISIISDTATDQIHSMNIYMADQDITLQTLQCAADIMRAADDWPMNEEDTSEWMDSVRETVASSEDAYLDLSNEALYDANLMVTASYVSEDSCYIWIDAYDY